MSDGARLDVTAEVSYTGQPTRNQLAVELGANADAGVAFAMLYTVSQKKVPTFKLSVTLSNLNRFSKILHC